MYPKAMSWYMTFVVFVAAIILGQSFFIHASWSVGILIMAIGNEIGAFGRLTLLRGHG